MLGLLGCLGLLLLTLVLWVDVLGCFMAVTFNRYFASVLHWRLSLFMFDVGFVFWVWLCILGFICIFYC